MQPLSSSLHQSLWLASSSHSLDSSQRLQLDVSVDVAVIGAGLTGVCVAMQLKEAGLTVAVLDEQPVARQVTAHTTGKLTSLHTLIYAELTDKFDAETAAIYAAANQDGIRWVAERVARYKIDCDFAPATAATYAAEPQQREQVEREVAAAQALGLPATFVEELDLPFATYGAVRFADQAQFHAHNFVSGLAARIPGDRSYLFENTKATGIERDNERMVVQTERGRVIADDVVIATNFPFTDPAFYFARMAPYRTYLVAADLRGTAPAEMLIAADSSHTLRSYPRPGGQTLITGGQGHKVGQGGDTTARYRAIADWLEEWFPGAMITHRWSSQGYITHDKIPYIGRATPVSKNLYVACGFNKWGLSHAPAAAMMIADLIQGRENDWVKVYDPNRFNTAGLSSAVKENVNVAKEYVKTLLPKGKAPSIELAPGEGQVVDGNGGRVALYRDDEGALHRRSALCTHMYCEVSWNPAEKSWDCPCHGSRFSATGEVIQGPAQRPLPLVEPEDDRE